GPQTVTTAGPGLTVLGGTTGTIAASAGVQAGNGLRIIVTDADLNTNATTVQTVQVTVTNTNLAHSDVETVTLTEDGINSSVFKATPPFPTSSTNAANVLWVVAQDVILIAYTDVHDLTGATVVADTTAYGTLWGDTSKNGVVRALDASLILQMNVELVTPPFDAYQFLVGDVNPAGVYPEGKSYPYPISNDATLILQYAVGLITSFPIEAGVPNPHPYKPVAAARRLALGTPAPQSGSLSVPLVVDNVDGVLSGNLTLSFDPVSYRVEGVSLTDRTSQFLVASKAVDGQLRIAFAGAQSESEGMGALLTIAVTPLAGTTGEAPLRFEEVSLNGGETQVELVAGDAALLVPQASQLLPNWPNPFNPETSIRYQLAGPGTVRLTIYDALGQSVRTLVDETQQAGSYSVTWDGLSNAGRRAATGIYFYTLETGGAVQTRKMTLLR
ncbi:MAG: FlgD immunoglobulin-like domain containing protein, partial [Gemmatimonadota bacterium]